MCCDVKGSYDVYLAELYILFKTSCCSIDSERPHRCCHLANNFGSRRIFPISLGRDMCPKLLLPWGVHATVHVIQGFLGEGFALVPCGHARVAVMNTCPVCRNNITIVMRIFM